MGIDLSGAFQGKIDDALGLAQAKEAVGEFKTAARYFREVAQVYIDFARQTNGESLKRQRAALAQSYLDKAKVLEARKPGDEKVPSVGSEISRRDLRDHGGIDTEKSNLVKQIGGLITRVSVSWEDIAGLDEVKSELRSIYGIKLAISPDNVSLSQNLNVLLYGPPGTGKTLLAAAVSNSIEATFYCANASDLVSKWLGESSKMVATLFEQARHAAPAVIFIDEFDSLVGSRDQSSNQADVRILGSVLAELDGLNVRLAGDKVVIVIAATNVPWNLDKATVSRFSGGQVYIPLPDADARLKILELNITNNGLAVEIPLSELSLKTEGYSGREIVAICNSAIRLMINRLNPDLDKKVDEGLAAIRQYQLKVGPLLANEFEESMAKVNRSTSQADLASYHKWAL